MAWKDSGSSALGSSRGIGASRSAASYGSGGFGFGSSGRGIMAGEKDYLREVSATNWNRITGEAYGGAKARLVTKLSDNHKLAVAFPKVHAQAKLRSNLGK
jgi:hypothetical protein